jgi:Fe2+ transport system protein FeoA
MIQYLRQMAGLPRVARAAPPHAGGDTLHLGQIPLRQAVELVRIDLPADEIEPLLERGILPGCELCPVRHSPSGDPIVLVDGSYIAVRRETAACLCVRLVAAGN